MYAFKTLTSDQGLVHNHVIQYRFDPQTKKFDSIKSLF